MDNHNHLWAIVNLASLNSSIARSAADFGLAVVEEYHYDRCNKGDPMNSQFQTAFNSGQVDLRFNQAGHDCHCPCLDRLPVIQSDEFSLAVTLGFPTSLLSHSCVARPIRHCILPFTAPPWPKHQGRGSDPEEENKNFSGEACNGVGGAAAGERVGAMMGESGSD